MTESWTVGARAGGAEWELVFNGEKVSVRDDGKNSGDAQWRHTQLHAYRWLTW